MPPDSRVSVGVSVVVERDGRRLMVRRGGQQWYADGYDTWAHPGGWLDYGETPEQTAVREVLEETGVSVADPRLFGRPYVNANDSGSIWIVNLFVVAQYSGGVARVTEPDKCPEVAWVPTSEINDLRLFGVTRVFHDALVAA